MNLKLLNSQLHKWLIILVAVFFVSSQALFAQAGYSTNGSATSNGNNCFTVTPDAQNRTGSVWNNSAISLNSSFDFTFQVNLGSRADGADGMAFVLQRAGTTAIGYGGIGYDGLNPSLAIEYDTYQNNLSNNAPNYNDPAYDHISLQKNGDASAAGTIDVNGVSWVQAGTNANIKDGTWHTTRIMWDASAKILSVYFDGVLRLTYNNNIVSSIFGGNTTVYWGFTARTGFFQNAHQVCVVSTAVLSEPLAVAISQNNVTCNGGNNGSATTTFTGGVTPYSILWNTGATSGTISNLVAGIYSATVTDGIGSTASKSITISQPAPVTQPTITTSGPTTFCTGGSVTLTSSTAANYLWSPGGATSQSISAMVSGSYTVTVTDANGCTATSSPVAVNATDNQPPVIASCPSNISQNVDSNKCGAIVKFKLPALPPELDQQFTNSTTGTAGADQWQTFTAGKTGSLTQINLIHNGCQATSFTLTVYKGAGTSGTVLYSGYFDLGYFCSTEFGINIPAASQPSVTAGQVYTFRLQGSGLGFTAGSAPSGSYFASGYNFPPWRLNYKTFVAPSGVTDNCGVASIKSDYISGAFFSVGTTKVTYTATDIAGNTATCSFNVIVVNNVIPTITASGPTTFCQGDSVILTATAATSYLWSTGATTRSINVNASGNYSVKVTTDSGCSATSAPVSVTVTTPAFTCPANINVNVDSGALLASYPLINNLTDETGKYAAITLQGNPLPTVNNGVCQNGIYIGNYSNGQNVQTPNISSLTHNNFNLTVDFKLTQLPTSQYPVIMGGVSYRWLGIYVNAQGNVGIKFNNYSVGFSTTVLSVGQWYTGQLISDNGTARLYINGSLVHTQAVGTLITAGDYIFTTSDFSNGLALNGCIKNLKINNGSIACSAKVNYSIPTITAGCTGYTISQKTGLPSGSSFPVGTTTNTFDLKDASGNVVSTCSFNVTVTNSFQPTITASGVTTFCQGGSVTLIASPGSSYLWSNGATTQSIIVNASGSFSVMVFNTNGCSATSASKAVVVSALPVATASGNGPLTSGLTLTLFSSGGSSYSWTGPNGFSSIVQNPVIANAASANAGTYSVTVTNNGCSSIATTNVVVNTVPAGALNFDGINDYVHIGNPFKAFNKEITVEWSADIDVASQVGSGISQSIEGVDNASSVVWMMHYLNFGEPGKPHGMRWIVNDNGTFREVGAYVTTGWHRFVGVADAGGMKLYVDGVLAASSANGINTSVINVSNSIVHIGKDSRYGSGRWMKGTIDEVRIWNRALCLGEILNNQTGELPGIQNGLQSYYKFNQGNAKDVNTTVNTLTDTSGNNRNGSLQNFALTGPTSNWVAGNVSGTAPAFVPPTATASNSGPVFAGSVVNLFSSGTGTSSWTGPNGFTSTHQNPSIPGTTIAMAGTYTVTKTSNGCTAVATTNVVVYPALVIKNITVTLNSFGTASIVPASVYGGAPTTLIMSIDKSSFNCADIAASPVPVILTLRDSAGISSSKTAYVVVQDTIKPLIVPPANITVNTDAGLSTATVNLGVPVTSDNCSVASVTNTHPSTPFPAGVTTVTWTVRDNNNNISTATQTITVTDVEPPVITCVAPIVKANDINLCGAVVNYVLPFAGDNVSTKTTSISAGCSDKLIDFNLPVSNNVSSINFISSGAYADIAHGHGENNTITVALFNGTNWIVIKTLETGNADYHFGGTSISFPLIPQVTKIRFTSSDSVHCAFHFYQLQVKLNSSLITQTVGLPSGSSFPIGTTTNKFIATDAYGNKDSCSFTITVSDLQKPLIVGTPANITKPNDGGNCRAIVSWTAPTATDNCSGVTITSNRQLGDTFPVGVTTVTYTATDAKNNITTSQFTITVIDNEKPSITALADITVNTDNGKPFATLNIGTATGTDNCQVDFVVNDHPSTDYPIGITNVTWTVKDIHGNTKTAIQKITIRDTEKPVITGVPLPIIQTNDAGRCDAIVIWLLPRATDNSNVVTLVSTRQPGDTFPRGVTTVTYTATDNFNNVTTGSFTITITDNEAPTVNAKPVTITLINGMASITAGDINNNSSDNCGIIDLTASKTTFNCTNIGTNIVTLTAKDLHGNIASSPALVNVIGETPTAILYPLPANTIYTGGIPSNIYIGYGPQSVTLKQTVAGGSSFTYSWTGNGTLSCTNCESPVFAPTAPGYYTVTCTATNNYGCKIVSSLTICVRDIRVPGTNGSQVYVCNISINNPPQTVAMNVTLVDGYLLKNPEDKLGSCDMAACSPALNSITSAFPGDVQEAVVKDENTAEGLRVKVSPNPSSDKFTFIINSTGTSPVSIRIMNDLGQVLDGKSNVPSGVPVYLGSKLMQGMYYAEVLQQNERIIIKLIKLNK